MTFYQNGKKISKKKAEEIYGKEKVAERIQDAKETFFEDPLVWNAWADGFEIRFPEFDF